MPDEVRRAFVWMVGSLASVRLLLASEYWSRTLYQIAIPVEDPLFPQVLRDPLVLLLAALGPLSVELIGMWRPTVSKMRMAAAVEIVSGAVLLIHQASFYKATWVVIFWCGWFLAWLAWTAVRKPDLIRPCGPLLAQAIVAYFFLGGAVGKWTAGYWSGEVFQDILFRQHPGMVYQYLRTTFSESTLWQMAVIYSRTIVLVETAMVGIVFVPARVASVLIGLVSLGLWGSSSTLYEIAFPLIGLAAAAWFLSDSPRIG